LSDKCPKIEGDESSSFGASYSTVSLEFLGGTETKLSCASNIVCKAYCKLSKFRPFVVGFGRFGGKGFLKGSLKLHFLVDASLDDLFKLMT
jgi:hypothetical protein